MIHATHRSEKMRIIGTILIVIALSGSVAMSGVV